MIGKLTGIVDSVGADWMILDVNGVGYLVHSSSRTLDSVPHDGNRIGLFIETYVREDQIKLFGFLAESEREWFRLLQSVQGVGAKVALAILGILSPSEIANAVALQDKATVARAPGVGPKVAARIVSELKDKVPAFSATTLEKSHVALSDGVQSGHASSAIRDAVSALTNLGYSAPQASGAVAVAVQKLGDDAETSALIRAGLKELSS